MVWGVCLCAAVMTNSRLLLEKRRNSAKQVPLGDCGATEEGRQQIMRAWPSLSVVLLQHDVHLPVLIHNCIMEGSSFEYSSQGVVKPKMWSFLWCKWKTGYREAHSLGLWFFCMQVYGEKKRSAWWMSFFPYSVSFPVQMSSCLSKIV